MERPCNRLSTNDVQNGFVTVKWQHKVFQVRIPDVRRSIMFVGLIDSGDEPLQTVKRFLQSQTGKVFTFAWLITENGWTLSKTAKDNPLVFNAIIFVAKNTFHLSNC